jgi:hypothetical protein
MYRYVPACISMYIPEKPRIHESCIGMCRHVPACISIYIPEKPRIHESCIGMYRHVSACTGMYRYVPACTGTCRHVSACIGMYRHVPVCTGMYRHVPARIGMYRHVLRYMYRRVLPYTDMLTDTRYKCSIYIFDSLIFFIYFPDKNAIITKTVRKIPHLNPIEGIRVSSVCVFPRVCFFPPSPSLREIPCLRLSDVVCVFAFNKRGALCQSFRGCVCFRLHPH